MKYIHPPVLSYFSRRLMTACLVSAGISCAATSALANGIYRDGIGSRSISMGGADVAWAEGPLGGMAANPASIARLTSPTLEFSGNAAMVDGDFHNAANPNGSALRNRFGFWGETAFGMQLGKSPFSLAVGVFPEAASRLDWNYIDNNPGGAAGVSYGLQRHMSEILLLRSGVGLGWAIHEKLSLGASVGLVYNQNSLQAPYIFQNQPVLKGFKTLLDLDTEGFGVNGQVGLLYRPVETVQLGLSYKTPTTVHSYGTASGDVGKQLGLATAPFLYDAEVVNHFPQMISGGLSWQAHPRLRLTTQIDWIQWSEAFDNLDVRLSNGNNNTINGAVGSAGLNDLVPLNWKDQFVYRVGGEFALTENLFLRAGYSYGQSPVPESTLTPVTAAIPEHILGAGLGWNKGKWKVDLGYQWAIPNKVHVTASGLRSGEYNNSTTEVGYHSLAVTTSYQF